MLGIFVLISTIFNCLGFLSTFIIFALISLIIGYLIAFVVDWIFPTIESEV